MKAVVGGRGRGPRACGSALLLLLLMAAGHARLLAQDVTVVLDQAAQEANTPQHVDFGEVVYGRQLYVYVAFVNPSRDTATVYLPQLQRWSGGLSGIDLTLAPGARRTARIVFEPNLLTLVWPPREVPVRYAAGGRERVALLVSGSAALPPLSTASLADFAHSFAGPWDRYLGYRIAATVTVFGTLVLLLWVGVPAIAGHLRARRRPGRAKPPLRRLRRAPSGVARATTGMARASVGAARAFGAWSQGQARAWARRREARIAGHRERRALAREQAPAPAAQGHAAGPAAARRPRSPVLPRVGHRSARRHPPTPADAFEARLRTQVERVKKLRQALAAAPGGGPLLGLMASLRAHVLLWTIRRSLARDVKRGPAKLETFHLLWGIERAQEQVGRTRLGAVGALEEAQEYLEAWIVEKKPEGALA